MEGLVYRTLQRNCLKVGPKSKAPMFSDNEGDFKWDHAKIGDEHFWVDTNLSGKNIRQRNSILDDLFPNIRLNYIY